jgi:diaminopimelate epimerase
MEYPEQMKIAFQKMHGTLNDFVVFHDLDSKVALSPEQVARICDRRAGVGADGVIVVRPSDKADFFMDYINADGSVAEMCGNGIRCLSKYVYDNGLTGKTVLPVETRAGVKTVELIPGPDGRITRVRVDMGQPIFEPDRIPAKVDTDGIPVIDYPVESEGRLFQATLVSMGNPHCVIVVEEDPGNFPAKFGPSIEHHPMFPARTNVEFIRVTGANRLLMRVWERGCGETFACGTGACAAVVAASLKGLVDGLTVVELLGGDLDIEWKNKKDQVVMTGPAVFVFESNITV